MNGPAIAARGERVGVAWFTAPGGAPHVRFAWSADGGASFAPALELDGVGSFGQTGLVLAADGTAKVTWWRAAANGTDLVLRTVAPTARSARRASSRTAARSNPSTCRRSSRSATTCSSPGRASTTTRPCTFCSSRSSDLPSLQVPVVRFG